jgi:hypothetical protein
MTSWSQGNNFTIAPGHLFIMALPFFLENAGGLRFISLKKKTG